MQMLENLRNMQMIKTNQLTVEKSMANKCMKRLSNKKPEYETEMTKMF